MLEVTDDETKQTLLLNKAKNSLGNYLNADNRIMGSDIREELSKTLDKFPEAFTSDKGTLLWEYKPTRFPLTELVESYSLVRGVTCKAHAAWGVDCYGAQLMVRINGTEENKALLEKYRTEVEGLSSDYVSVSVDSFAVPSIMIRTPTRAVGENTGVDIAAIIAKFMKVEEKLLEMTYELR